MQLNTLKKIGPSKKHKKPYSRGELYRYREFVTKFEDKSEKTNTNANYCFE